MGVIALGSSSSVMISTLIMLTSDLVVKLVEILRLLGFAYEQIWIMSSCNAEKQMIMLSWLRLNLLLFKVMSSMTGTAFPVVETWTLQILLMITSWILVSWVFLSFSSLKECLIWMLIGELWRSNSLILFDRWVSSKQVGMSHCTWFCNSRSNDIDFNTIPMFRRRCDRTVTNSVSNEDS